jgi:hypothetical protein
MTNPRISLAVNGSFSCSFQRNAFFSLTKVALGKHSHRYVEPSLLDEPEAVSHLDKPKDRLKPLLPTAKGVNSRFDQGKRKGQSERFACLSSYRR